ncbi:MAG: hypothetical protein ACP5UH_00135 [Candidatus Micrarchaeia archaeon]
MELAVARKSGLDIVAARPPKAERALHPNRYGMPVDECPEASSAVASIVGFQGDAISFICEADAYRLHYVVIT